MGLIGSIHPLICFRGALFIMKQFRDLSYQDLNSWVGSQTASRGRSYQRSGYVLSVYQISDDIICGSVEGTKEYHTVVSGTEGLSSRCTCPVGSDCKHGVALMMEYLERLKRGVEVSKPPENEYERTYLPLLDSGSSNFVLPTPVHNQKKDLQAYLQSLSKDDLINIILSGLEGHDLAVYLNRRQRIEESSSDSSQSAIIAEIELVTSEEVSYSDWYEIDEEDMPDYSGIYESFSALLEAKRYADLISLGHILLEKSAAQLEMDDESGSISSQISECIKVVAKAFERSDLPVHQKILSAIELIKEDEYDLTDDIRGFIHCSDNKSEWSKVADCLLGKNKGEREDGESSSEGDLLYYADWIEMALKRSGRSDEAIEFARRLAEEQNRDLPFISLLLQLNKKMEAIEWIKKSVYKKRFSPYEPIQLFEILRTIYEESGDWLMITALDTEIFMRNPSLYHYKTMMTSAKKAGVSDSIRPYIHAFLKDGILPTSSEEGSILPGILPETGVTLARRNAQVNYPVRDLLLEMAIDGNDPKEVFLWYTPNPRRVINNPRDCLDDRIADAIVKKNPEQAIMIWKQLAETLINLKNPGLYVVAVSFLMKGKAASQKSGKSAEFEEYILHLKTEHAKKRRFIQDLAVLEGKRIIDDM